MIRALRFAVVRWYRRRFLKLDPYGDMYLPPDWVPHRSTLREYNRHLQEVR